MQDCYMNNNRPEAIAQVIGAGLALALSLPIFNNSSKAAAGCNHGLHILLLGNTSHSH
jgi:hypothetical protein